MAQEDPKVGEIWACNDDRLSILRDPKWEKVIIERVEKCESEMFNITYVHLLLGNGEKNEYVKKSFLRNFKRLE